MGIEKLVNAFIEGNAGTDGEDQNGDDERPEEDLGAVAERVLVVGRPLGALHAEQQQALIAGIDHGVHRLREHGRRAGDERSREFTDRNQGVTDQRSVHDLVRSGLHAVSGEG